MNAKTLQPIFGKARYNAMGPSSEMPNARGQAALGLATGSERKAGAALVLMSGGDLRRFVVFGMAAIVASALCACGRGPVEPPPLITTVASIQFQVWVAGQIDQTQGDYIVAINANLNPSTNVNAVAGETPGEPTAQEAQGSPPSYTHWDQELIYGSTTISHPNGFDYKYKVLTGSVGSTQASFFPIVLTTNQFQLITNGSVGTGSGNVLSIQIPLSEISVRGNPNGSNPPTISKPPVTQIYVNYITTDTFGNPQDQLGALGLGTVGFTQLVVTNVMTPTTTQLPNFSSATGPPNPALFLIGGQITVTP